MKPPAYTSHSAPGRYRLRIPSKRYDTEYFTALESDIAASNPDIGSVIVNPVSASVLILYDQQLLNSQELLAQLNETEHFEISTTPANKTSIFENASKQVTKFDKHLRESTEEHLDLQSLLFIVFVLMAVRQLRSGAIFGPAATLFWYALQILMKKK